MLDVCNSVKPGHLANLKVRALHLHHTVPVAFGGGHCRIL